MLGDGPTLTVNEVLAAGMQQMLCDIKVPHEEILQQNENTWCLQTSGAESVIKTLYPFFSNPTSNDVPLANLNSKEENHFISQYYMTPIKRRTISIEDY